MSQYIHFTTYSPAADIVVMAICLVMVVLVFFSYFSRTRSSRLFLAIVGLVYIASFLDVFFYSIVAKPDHQVLANWLRCVFHAALLLIFVYFIAYICEVTHYEKRQRFLFIGNTVFAIVMLADVIVTAQGLTFVVDESGISFIRRGIFIYGYLGYTILCIILLTRVRKHVFHRVMLGFYGTIAISILLLIMQGLCNQSSFTVATLLLPVVAMMYMMHSNSYDILLGTNDAETMQDFVHSCYVRKQDFIFMSLYMRDFDEEGKELPQSLQSTIRQFTYKCARKSRLFKAAKGHMVLMFLKKQYPDYEQKIHDMIDAFVPVYEEYRYDYKVVIGSSVDEISRKNEYISYIRSIQRTMPECSFHLVGPEDVVEFNRKEYILNELADICRCGNLDDPRVQVYCQPVLNVRTGKYDTAEALMRLKLEETGMVYPNQFIQLAEEQGYIHMLTEIILHKTCEAIRRFTEKGYDIKRISVNVSVPELKDESFCRDIIGIIRRSSISSDKIAIELTESQNEGDFILMKQKISELKEKGIQFYLDDFGTGYSSMERIMELPFDIIKFDRSLVIASGSEDRSRKMVTNLASMFSSMDYYVLYEGVEKDTDEVMCKGMSASYLQGYKYSKPVPIENLKDYLSSKAG